MIDTLASIIIPTYNRANLLPMAIDSCLQQTINCEIIVCDHGSTDDTPAVMQKYSSVKNIKYIRKETDFGPHYTWLDATLHCTHQWVHIQYDDDWIEPAFMEKALELTNDEIAFVCTNAIIHFEETKIEEHSIFFKKLATGIHSSKYPYAFLMKNVLSPGACLLRKEEILNNLFIGKIPLANTHYHGVGPDILFALSSCINYPQFGYVNEPLAFFRAHSGSITIDAQQNNKQAAITKAYNEARKYAKVLKANNTKGLKNFIFNFLFKKN